MNWEENRAVRGSQGDLLPATAIPFLRLTLTVVHQTRQPGWAFHSPGAQEMSGGGDDVSQRLLHAVSWLLIVVSWVWGRGQSSEATFAL